MFSKMIQSMLNSGGKAAAMQRATHLNNYVNHATISAINNLSASGRHIAFC